MNANNGSGVLDPQRAVDELLGEGKAEVIESSSSTKVTDSEVVLINGQPVQLIGVDGLALRESLIAGRLPDRDLLSRVLSSALGVDLKGVTKIESEVSVKSKLSTKDSLALIKGGNVVEVRSQEWSADNASSGRKCETFPKNAPATLSNPGGRPLFTASPCSTARNTPTPNSRESMTPTPTSMPGRSPTPRSRHSSSSNLSSREHQISSNASMTPSVSQLSKDKEIATKYSTNDFEYCPPTTRHLPEGVQPSPGPSRNQMSPLALRDSPDFASSRKQQSGLCLSPDLEESLARTSIKDPLGMRAKDRKKIAAKEKNTKSCEIKDTTPQNTTSQSSKDLQNKENKGMVYDNNLLVSGSLDSLIQHATPRHDYLPSEGFMFPFLLSARLFRPPHSLLAALWRPSLQATHDSSSVGSLVNNLVKLLSEWSENFPYDFRDEQMMSEVRSLTHRCISVHPAARRDVTQALHNLLNKLTELERYEDSLAKLSSSGVPESLENVCDISDSSWTSRTVAEQLTCIELERLSFIGPEEFVQAFAKDNMSTTPQDVKKTNNLECYVQWFNRLSFLVATQSCTPLKKKRRARAVEAWIEVGRECFNIGNFNSLMAIIAGLNMTPIARLKKTWSKIETAKFSILEHQMDPSNNFSSYRSTLKAAMWRSEGAVEGRRKVVIPFFSLLVKDLYFLNERCAHRLASGMINFEKWVQLASKVREFSLWKGVATPFERDPLLIAYLQSVPVLGEAGLSLMSFEREGPDNGYEKERLKTLRVELQAVS